MPNKSRNQIALENECFHFEKTLIHFFFFFHFITTTHTEEITNAPDMCEKIIENHINPVLSI